MSTCPAVRYHRLAPALWLTVAALAAGLAAALAGGATASAASQQGTRARLRSLRERITAITRADRHDAAERDRLTGQLRAAELSLSSARAQLAQVDRQLDDQTARRAALTAARARQARELQSARGALGQELRAAYRIRQTGALELLLDQDQPLASERLMTYYGYFSRAQAAHIAQLRAQLQQLNTLDATLAQQQGALTALRQQQQSQLAALAAAGAQRRQVLIALTLRAQTRHQQLAQLQAQQAALARVVTRLGRASVGASAAPDLHGPFARLRGELAWPVNGRLTAEFGQLRPSGVPWDGILIATRQDAPVHAVSAGRVVYADWLPGLGLLVILDHGDGYLSLYGHNDRLYKAVGAAVKAGEVIAAAGDSGGRADPQLYFEIRRAGKPVNPLPWFRTPRPAL